MDELKADKASMLTYLTSTDEAVEILVDLVNKDYSVKSLINDFYAHFEPDDREDKDEGFVLWEDN